MPLYTEQRQVFENSAQNSPYSQFVTIGTVIDTNDPQQMGRIRVVCPQWGDTWNNEVESIPWALYMSPFGGQTQVGTRGPGIQESEGGIAYGMWAIPKVGSQVAVLCIDGNPMTRMYIGCIYDQFTPHTLPHGRYMYDDHPNIEKEGSDAAPYGPYTSTEKFIQPLAANIKQAFGHKSEPNYEYRSRGADYSVSRVDVSQLNQTHTSVQDDKNISHDGWISTQGYQSSRSDPHAQSSYTDKNYDSMIYSFTSPGFHSLSMDDRQENCRVRLRTTSGHQILLDDTNERIYISTAKGNNWIEMDQDGNMDVFCATNLNIHSGRSLNFTADETIRMYAKQGVHIHSDKDIRVKSAEDIHIKTDANIRVSASSNINIQTDASLNIKSLAAMYIDAAADINIKSGANINNQSASKINALAGSDYVITTGGNIHLNGPSAGSAGPASGPDTKLAFFTSRVPTHEPFARTMTKDDTTHDPEYEYTDKNVGKLERGRQIIRGLFWRR
jgi:Type VI secretion system/phage-baseplate injector OB domain